MTAFMIEIIRAVKDVVIKFENVKIDNSVSRLHYKLTVMMLMFFSILVTSKQYFGDPIDCETEGKNLDSYCWITSTFTYKKHHKGALNIPYQGVGPGTDKDEIVHHKYYQWVCFVLALQAAMFYLPHHLWKVWEGGRLKSLASDLGDPIITDKWDIKRKSTIINYLAISNLHTHNVYAMFYVICELLNLFNVIGQMFLINYFLGGSFFGYGPAFAAFATQSESNVSADPVSYIFPKMAKCTYQNYGPSGTVQDRDALCVLPLNIINEKIYAVIWFWFVILSFISLISLGFRIACISSSKLKIYLLMAQARAVKKEVVREIVNEMHYGDWFLLTMLGRNVNPIIFRQLLEELALHINGKQRKGSKNFVKTV